MQHKGKEKQNRGLTSQQREMAAWMDWLYSSEAGVEEIEQRIKDLDQTTFDKLLVSNNVHWSKHFFILQALKSSMETEEWKKHLRSIAKSFKLATLYYSQHQSINSALTNNDWDLMEEILEKIAATHMQDSKKWRDEKSKKVWEDLLALPLSLTKLCNDLCELGESKLEETFLARVQERYDNQLLNISRDQLPKFESHTLPLLKRIFLFYEFCGIPDHFYESLFGPNPAEEAFPQQFDEVYISTRLKDSVHERQKDAAHERLYEYLDVETTLTPEKTLEIKKSYEQLKAEELFQKQVQEFYDLAFEKITIDDRLPVELQRYLSIKNHLPGILYHRKFELLALQYRIFSLLETHYGKKSSRLFNYKYDSLLERRDEVFDYCNPATLRLHKEDMEKRTQDMLRALSRFIAQVKVKANNHTFTQFLDAISKDKHLCSCLNLGPETETNKKNKNLMITTLHVFINEWRPMEDRKKEARDIEEETAEELEEGGKEKEKSEEKENISHEEERITLKRKVNLMLIGKDTLASDSAETVKPEQGRNYLYWMRDRASFSFRLQHVKHGSTGIKRARALLEFVNRKNVSLKEMKDEIIKSYRESANRTHSASRYLKAGLNDLPLETILALKNDDFKKIREPLFHCELTEKQVEFLDSQSDLFSRKKISDTNELDMRNDIQNADSSNKERYIAALKYIAAYPGNPVSKQLLTAIQSASRIEEKHLQDNLFYGS